ncbi:acyl-CoA thioesterase [Photobacterium nomapromontoriensis]|uniref:acyl-CoA thioesterase n=1 Tax=Photobacterium nomapromontoriensis TaxID=2910237 RepID=UPI003D098C81
MKTLLDGYPVISEIPVAWGEMDALNHVNNVVYFRYFETARLDYFSKVGLMEEMKATYIGPILSETTSRYKLPVTYPDTLLVGSRVSEMQRDRFTMEYIIVSKQQGKVTTVGQAKVVMYNFANNTKAIASDRLLEKILAVQPELVVMDNT